VHRAATSALMISTQVPSTGVVSTRTPSPASEGKTMAPLAGQLVASAPVDPIASAPVDPIERGLAATVGDARVAEAPRVKAGATVHRSPVPESTPQDMLQQANDLRARHQWLAATQIYEKTLHTFPGRAEAYSAMIAAGMLHLDQLGDAKGALSLFSSAIQARPQGPLSEEARWGVVRGHRALVDSRSELAALQEFVALYPHSLLASRAQARLRELRGETATQ
jgi:TolA-binding protein